METAVAARVSIPERQVSGNVPSEESRNHGRNAAGQSFSALFSSTTSDDEAQANTRPSRPSSSDGLQSDDKERRSSSRNGVNPQSAIPGVPDLFTLLPLSLKLPVGLGLQLPGAAESEKAPPAQSTAGKEGQSSAPPPSGNSTTTDTQSSSVSYGDLAFGLHLSSITPVSQPSYPQQKLPLRTDSGQRPAAGATDPGPEPTVVTSAADQIPVPAVTAVALKDPSDSGRNTPGISAVSSILPVTPDGGLGSGGAGVATSLSARASQPTSTPTVNAPAVSEIRATETPRTAPVREISIDLPGADLSKVAIQLTERNGDLRVSVRTADTNLASDLRLELKDLVSNLKQEGFKVESWAPAAPVVETQTHSHDYHESGNKDQQQHTGGGDTGQRDGSPRDQRRQRQTYPGWITEFENHIDNTRTQNS